MADDDPLKHKVGIAVCQMNHDRHQRRRTRRKRFRLRTLLLFFSTICVVSVIEFVSGNAVLARLYLRISQTFDGLAGESAGEVLMVPNVVFSLLAAMVMALMAYRLGPQRGFLAAAAVSTFAIFGLIWTFSLDLESLDRLGNFGPLQASYYFGRTAAVVCPIAAFAGWYATLSKR